MSEPTQEFMAYKYEAVPHIVALNLDPKIATSVGWKIRKSINWKDTHAGDVTRDMLKELGDALVDDSECDPGSFAVAHQMLVKRSRYNSETKAFDRPPKIRDEWKNAQKKIELASAHPGYLAKELLSSCHRPQLDALEAAALQQWLHDHARNVFYCEVIYALVSSIRSAAESTQYFPHESAFKEYGDGLPVPNLKMLIKIFKCLYSDYDLEPPLCKSVTQYVTALASDLGLPTPSSESIQISLPEDRYQKPSEYRFHYLELEGLDLVKFSSEAGYTLISINTNHPLSRLAMKAPEASKVAEVMISGLLASSMKLNIKPEIIEDLFKYTALHIRSNLASEQKMEENNK
jgi:hypothetical protein